MAKMNARSAEARRKVQAAHQKNPGGSHAAVAEAAGVSVSTVRKYRPPRQTATGVDAAGIAAVLSGGKAATAVLDRPDTTTTTIAEMGADEWNEALGTVHATREIEGRRAIKAFITEHENSNLPSYQIAAMARHKSPKIRKLAARKAWQLDSEHTGAMELMAADKNAGVRAAFAEEAVRCPPDAVDRLSVDRRAKVRAALAKNPAIDILYEDDKKREATANRLAGDRSGKVRRAVAANRHMPKSAYHTVLHSSRPRRDLGGLHIGNKQVRINLARNRSCPESLLPELASDPDVTVAVRIARRQPLPAPDVYDAAYRNVRSRWVPRPGWVAATAYPYGPIGGVVAQLLVRRIAVNEFRDNASVEHEAYQHGARRRARSARRASRAAGR